MFKINKEILKNVLENVKYCNNTIQNIVPLCYEKLESRLWYQCDSKHIVMEIYEESQYHRITFPINEEGVKLYIDLVVMELNDDNKEKAYKDFLEILSSKRFKENIINFTKEYFLQKTKKGEKNV